VGAGVNENFAEEFAVGGMDGGMGREDFGEFGERAAGSQEQRGPGDFETLLGDIGLGGADCFESQAAGFFALLIEKSLGFVEGHFLGGVVGLAEGVAESRDEMRALTGEDDGLIFF